MNINRFRFCARLTAACVPILCFGGTHAKVNIDFGKVPLSFEANRGQTDARVDYLSRGKGYTLFLTRGQAVLRLEKDSLLRMKLKGASGTAAASGVDRLPGVANYFQGHDPSQWRTRIPTYQKVKYTGVYPGVDLVYYGNQGRLEHDFIVAPRADPSTIVLTFEGVQPRIDRQGDLCLTIDGRELQFQKPVVYQSAYQAGGGGKQIVEGRYRLDGNTVRFELGTYDHSRELVIDPLLVYGSYLGGSGEDYGTGIAVDSQGSAYATGWTTSTNFPTENPIQGGLSGTYSVYVSKFNAAGTALIYSTYLGGSLGGAQSFAYDIAVDSKFNAYVAGTTNAPDFPVTGGAYQTVCAAIFNGTTTVPGCDSFGGNGFLTKIDSNGSALAYSTFLGGNSGSAIINGVAVDSAFEAYVTGYEEEGCGVGGSPYCTVFPTTSGALMAGNWLCCNPYAFISKFDDLGANLLYSSLYGSLTPTPNPDTCTTACTQNTTEAQAIAIDTAGDAYITGWTQDGNLPVTTGAFQTTAKPILGSSDPINYYAIEGERGFVAKFDPTQSGTASLIYASYLGGTTPGDDYATGIAIDAKGDAYITGSAGSPDFPTTKGAFQRTCYSPGGAECFTAFITKFNPNGTGLVYSTMLGDQADGDGASVYAGRIRVNSSGDAFVAGVTGSGFPLENPISTTGSAFLTELNPTGTALLFSTYFGGTYVFGGQFPTVALALDPVNSVYLTGTTGGDFPVTPTAFQQNSGGGEDAFVAKIATADADVQVTNSAPKTVATGADLTYTITAGNNGPDTAPGVVVTDTVPAGSTFVSVTTSAGTCKSPAPGGTGTISCSIGSLVASDTATVTLTVKVDAAVGTILTDTARIYAVAFDPDTANNNSTVRTKAVQ
jgi:uncharacterized repeat protein (TIGR01451 family)